MEWGITVVDKEVACRVLRSFPLSILHLGSKWLEFESLVYSLSFQYPLACPIPFAASLSVSLSLSLSLSFFFVTSPSSSINAYFFPFQTRKSSPPSSLSSVLSLSPKQPHSCPVRNPGPKRRDVSRRETGYVIDREIDRERGGGL